MLKKYIVRLTADERRTLREVVKQLNGSGQKVLRAQMLLKADVAGPSWTDERIAEAFDSCSRTVEKLHERFVTEGFDSTLHGKARDNLASIGSQIRAQQAAVDLANKEYFPDTEVFGRYDTFWQPASTQGDLRGQVGVRLNVPIYRDRRHAAVREASYKLSQKQAEFDQKRLDVEYEVQQAYAQFEESRQALRLYSDKFVPITEQNVAAARSNYDVGKLNFLELATTQRQLIEVREQHQEALAAYFRRIAELERVIGGPLPTPLAFPLEEVAVPQKE